MPFIQTIKDLRKLLQLDPKIQEWKIYQIVQESPLLGVELLGVV